MPVMEIRGLSYLRSRGLTMQTINEFDLMFFDGAKLYYDRSIRNRSVLDHARSVFDFKTNDGDYHYRNRFKNSILIPIYDLYGDYVAMMTRKLEPDPRKFDATPFEKRYILYGLNMAVPHIIAQKCVFVTEGVFDMLMMWQYGIRNTVAANGCRITSEQIHLCSRFTDNFNIIFDPDKAGVQGSSSVLDTLKKYGLKGRRVLLNSAVDLDEYLLSSGPKEILRYVQNTE